MGCWPRLWRNRGWGGRKSLRGRFLFDDTHHVRRQAEVSDAWMMHR